MILSVLLKEGTHLPRASISLLVNTLGRLVSGSTGQIQFQKLAGWGLNDNEGVP